MFGLCTAALAIAFSDVFLIGPPGPYRRRIAMRYCEVAEREVRVVGLACQITTTLLRQAEYLAITRDTTEADLKQRAEVTNKTLHYQDQAPVT
jgi:von Willebrand factor A domain-containing protein 8